MKHFSKFALLLAVALAVVGCSVAIVNTHGKAIKSQEIGIRPVGNNNWQIWCHYTHNNGSKNDKYIATLNTDTVSYGDSYSQAVAQCKAN